MAKSHKKPAKPKKAKGNVAKKIKAAKPSKPKSSGKPVKAKKKAVAAKPAKASKPVAKKLAKKLTKAPKAAVKATPKVAAPVKVAKKTPAKDPVVPPVRRFRSLNDPFLKKQRERLLQLKDTLLDSMSGVARDSLRSRAEGSEASAFGMHQADAGSDAYDRDFALSLISQEQDALYEIDEALKRIENGTYGGCEISGKNIPRPRLEALPFTRYTVECQTELEKNSRYSRVRQPVTSLFGLGDDDSGDDDDDSSTDNKE